MPNLTPYKYYDAQFDAIQYYDSQFDFTEIQYE